MPRPELEALRAGLTRELAAAGAGKRVSISTIEWWRTCCEPGIHEGTRFEVKRVRLADLKRELASVDFTPGADPDRTVWVVAALGQIGRGATESPVPWAVFALDVDDHVVLGVQFGEIGERPPYFDRLPER